MSDEERSQMMLLRRERRFPKHALPHFDFVGERQYLISATCYEHAHVIGKTRERMNECEESVLAACQKCSAEIYAWCILPNHYHVLLRTGQIKDLRKELGLFHGRSSHQWNKEDGKRGRHVWHNFFDRAMKSERHFWVSLNYVHHNPVHHNYVERWQDWPWSSAQQFLEQTGYEKAAELWRDYPLLDYGKKWDK